MTDDTIEDWRRIGATEPWYGVLSAPEFLKQNLTLDAIEKFYAQGEAEIAWAVETLDRHFGPFSPRLAVDLGSGLGRLSFAMSRRCQEVFGLDVSPGMREEATRQANARGIVNTTFVETLRPDLQVDWINSYIVMQHILPRTGYGVLSDLLSRLALGGFVSIQLTFAHDLRDRSTLVQDLSTWRFDGETLTVLEDRKRDVGAMSMYDYDMNRVLMIFARIGVRDMLLRHTDHGGVHGFWIFGRKTL